MFEWSISSILHMVAGVALGLGFFYFHLRLHPGVAGCAEIVFIVVGFLLGFALRWWFLLWAVLTICLVALCMIMWIEIFRRKK